MRSRLVVCVAVLAAVAAACSGGGSTSLTVPEADATCALMGRLAESAEPLLDTGVSDPEEFSAALDAAVLDFGSTLDSLLAIVPDDVAADVEVLRGLVEQHRFQDAIEARASLDEYARRVCPETTTST